MCFWEGGFAPVCVAGCVCWYGIVIVLILLIPSGWSCWCSTAITRKLMVSSSPGTFYISKNPLLVLSQYFTLPFVGGWELSHFHPYCVDYKSQFLSALPQTVFCFQALRLINHYFLSDYANGINSVILFCALAISFQWLSAERLTSFSLKWTYIVMWVGRRVLKGMSGWFAAGSSSWSAPTEAMTKMNYKSLLYLLDPRWPLGWGRGGEKKT